VLDVVPFILNRVSSTNLDVILWLEQCHWADYTHFYQSSIVHSQTQTESNAISA